MKVILAGGGTGGHTFPLIAVERQIKKNSLNAVNFLYIGPKDKFTYTFIRKESIDVKFCRAGKIRRYSGAMLQNLLDIFFNVPIGIIQAFVIMFFEMPDLIFSKGGYGSFPVVVAGAMLGIPIALHESDVIPGKVNRMISSFSSKIYVSFPEEETEFFLAKKMMWTGNPIRQAVLNGSSNKARELFNLKYEKPTILILGGSQGSQRINELIIQIAPQMLSFFEIIHQTGFKDYERVRAQTSALIPENLKGEYHLYPFFDEEEMRSAYAASDTIVARAGSGTIFEISAMGKPSILIPLPEAAQNHQLKNALVYAKLTESAIVITEENLTPNFFLAELKNIFQFKNIVKMGENAKNFSKPDSAKIIADDIINFLNQ